MKKILLLILCFCLLTPVFAKPIKLKEGHPTRYTVQPGDTLWGVASRYLADPLQWPLLFHINPDMADPAKIYPGEVLVLSIYDGEPRLHIESGGTVKLSPKIRYEPLDHAIPVIPMYKVLPFIDASRVVSEAEMHRAAYVIAPIGEHVAAGAGDKIYVERLLPQQKNEIYFIYRLGEPYFDPVTRDCLGYEAIYVGRTQLLKEGNPAKLFVSAAKMEVKVGDRLLPADNFEYQDFFPRPPACAMVGQIISVFGGLTQAGQYNIVAVNLGRKNCLESGNILGVFKKGDVVNNPYRSRNSKPEVIQLPEERAGVVLIFRVFDFVSYGLILETNQAVNVFDIVTNPQNEDA